MKKCYSGNVSYIEIAFVKVPHLFSVVARQDGARVNGGYPAANLRDKPLLAILAQSRYVGHTSCGTSLLHAVMSTLK